MAELPVPTASRLPRTRWLDPRLLIGLLLVLASVVLGATVVAGADDRVQVWSLARDLGPGTALTRSDLTLTSVHLHQSAARRYLSARQRVTGLVVTRPLGRGELLPAAALRRAGTSAQRKVVVEVDRAGAAGLARGRVVDVYAVRDAGGDEPAPPQRVLTGVTVAEDVRTGSGGFGGGGATVGVALLVDEADVAAVLDAVAHGAVYLVQLPA